MLAINNKELGELVASNLEHSTSKLSDLGSKLSQITKQINDLNRQLSDIQAQMPSGDGRAERRLRSRLQDKENAILAKLNALNAEGQELKYQVEIEQRAVEVKQQALTELLAEMGVNLDGGQ